MKKYMINSEWGQDYVEVDDNKTRRQIVEDFLDNKLIEFPELMMYAIIDEFAFGANAQLSQFIFQTGIEETAKLNELEIIKII